MQEIAHQEIQKEEANQATARVDVQKLGANAVATAAERATTFTARAQVVMVAEARVPMFFEWYHGIHNFGGQGYDEQC